MLAWLSLRLRGLGWRDVGLTRPDGWARRLLLGIAAGIAMELFATFVTVNRVAGLGGGSRGAWVASLLLVSAFFGWGHEGQQVTGMLQESIAGLLLGLLYLGCRRRLFEPCVAHAASNTVAFALIYLDRYPGV